ncbi:NFX1-type zinc finger-containing protein 1-like [Ylistrum balloti]|uniref:NFX1-type zinc finger-containing protein 1-like n=1 Tax=Ylistrum balloti TaxID=509963 RepID=UPI00290592D0|nr:NFX1-type zinc finger-containing protein 1-like [Ylistrum balloti]
MDDDQEGARQRDRRGDGGGRGGGRGDRGDGNRRVRRGDLNRGRGRDDRQARAPRPWRTRLGFKRLNELQHKEPSDILITIAHSDSGLQEGLNDATLSNDFISLFLRCIAKACRCQSSPAKVIQLLTCILNSTFINCTLPTFMSRMILEKSPVRQLEFRAPLHDTIFIMSEIARRSPSSITSVFGVMGVMQSVLNTLRATTDIIEDDLWKDFNECCMLRDHMLAEAQVKSRKREQTSSRHDDDKPPDNFREISVFPEKSDVQNEEGPFLRRNKIKGGFQNLDHYLDVQFRLLREDFVGPLRDGINGYIAAVQTGKSKRSQEMRVYYDVQVICPIGASNGLCHRISFDVSRMQRVNWESSKRLIFGSLVCFSSDNFRTLLFATVAERDPKKLKEGILDVKFEGVSNRTVNLHFNKKYVMAETVAYFEAYRHVLKGLQKIDEGDLPFEKYIIKCNTKMQAPLYLRQNDRLTLDMRPLVDEGFIISSVRQHELRNLNKEFSERAAVAKSVEVNGVWPSAELLHLDQSQYKAVKRALTSEFVLTQGPPGTGKTYIGLKIVKALLHNHSIWNTNPDTHQEDHRPMLVVCYTNHALDQFIEGICDFFKGSILRVGGRSTSEAMKKYNLNSMRSRIRELREVPDEIHRGRMNARNQMKDLQHEINRISSSLEIASREVLNEDVLESFMGRFYADISETRAAYFDDGFQTQQRKTRAAILDWLNIDTLTIGEEEQNLDLREGLDAAAEVPNQDHAQFHAGDAQQPEHQDDPNDEDDELVDVLDEVDAMVAQREIDEYLDDGYDVEMEKAEVVMLKMQLSKNSVALNVTNLEEKDTNHDDGWQMTKKQKKALKRRLRRELGSEDRMDEAEIERIYDVWELSQKDKWRLYRYWVNKFSEKMRDKIRLTVREYQSICDQHQEVLMQEDKGIIRKATVVGMTTTGAAKYQAVLQEIGPRVIVVEEAAEVLEAHVITTLSRDCQHLILIGDHKQLRPNPTVYKLAKEYNLDLSLFERMIKNDIDLDCLELQHRMRPEISKIMTLIYPELKDHDIVRTYDNIKGTATNAFFINHSFREQEDVDLKSHSNIHEAKYIAGLCKYFLLQGYEPDQITILTLYSGQLFTIRKEMPKQIFSGVRITVVDNFQGEENDIVLLSLVRSNSDGKIGFLKIDNRVCVALSRAKKGMFVIGNMDIMAQGSRLWKHIVSHAQKERMIGEGLKLICQNHPEDGGMIARVSEDFQKAPEGGCMKPCQFRLECGHTCSMVCHVLDQKHEKIQCRKRCERIICDNKHKCNKLCYQKCGECHVLVQKKIPQCGHKQDIPCHIDPAYFRCKERCSKILLCGHRCAETCGEDHTTKCQEYVQKIWPSCRHVGMVKCFQKDITKCVEGCQDVLECDHLCAGSCGSCSHGRLHKACTKQCGRTLICGHLCTDRCSRCPPCVKRCENRCIHSRCNNRCGEPCVPCNEPCEWTCKHFTCTKLCCEPCERPRCNKSCKNKLKCGHKCIGMCGEKCPSLCRVCNRDIVTEIFFGDEDEPDARFIQLEDCGHVIEVNAMDTYMDQDSSDEISEIIFKGCPKCKTPIRKNLRYGNAIKQTLHNIEQVKRKLLGDEQRIKDLLEETPYEIEQLEERDKILLMKRFEEILQEKDISSRHRIKPHSVMKLSEETLLTVKNQATFLERIKEMKKKNRAVVVSSESNDIFEEAKEHLEQLRLWILNPRSYFTQQESLDVTDEICRLRDLRNFLLYKTQVSNRKMILDGDLVRRMRVAEVMLTDGKKFTEEKQKKVKRTLQMLKDVVPGTGLGISEEERIQIIQAMGMGNGHWFKCPNGHVYAIGDCGGATIEGRCPECNATIGGSRHTLRSDNALAPEMDGAAVPAWPTALVHNIENFHIN